MVNQKNTKKSQKSQRRVKKGGSLASDKVMKVANDSGMTVDDYQNKMPLPAMGSLKKQSGGTVCAAAKKQNGGGNKNKKHTKRRTPQRKPKRRTKKVNKKGQKGGNFLNLAGCGPVNAPDAGRKHAKHFSKTSSCPGPEFYANPPELAKAGSGTGNSYPFN